MKRPLIATGICLLILLGAYFHFHDGPPPDLSRFTRTTHDPVAFAEVKRITDEIRATFKEYKPVDPGDPDDDMAEDDLHSLDGLACRRDPNALRALRRHLNENERAIAAAHKLLALEKIAFEPLVPGNAISTRNESFPGIKHSFRLLHRETLLAGIENHTEAAWANLAKGLRFVRNGEKTQSTLIMGLTLVAMEDIDLTAANELAAFEKSPEHIHKFMTIMEANRPDPLRFKIVFTDEFLGIADTFLPSRGGKLRLREFMATGMGSSSSSNPWEWLKNAGETSQSYWLQINCLPNDTFYEYGQIMDRELSVTTPTFAKPQARPKWGLWLLSRNAGGTSCLDMLTGNVLSMMRNRYFKNAARHDLTRVALALRVYQLTHDGKRPATLAALASDILPSIPTDPFAGGAPIHYDPITGKVWSVGANGKDDAGDPDSDITVAPPDLTPPPAKLR